MSSLVPEQTGEAVGLPKRYLIRFGCVAESGFAFWLDFNAGSHHSTASKDCCDSGPSWSKPDEPSVSVAISLRQIRCRKNLVGHRASHFDVSLFGNLHHAFLYIDVTVCVSLWEQVHVDWALALGRRILLRNVVTGWVRLGSL